MTLFGFNAHYGKWASTRWMPARFAALIAALILIAPPGLATCGGGGGGGGGGLPRPTPVPNSAPRNSIQSGASKNGTVSLGSFQIYQVPWRWLASSAEDFPTAASTASVALYWIPRSEQEYRNSTLRASRTLALYASRCVQLYVVDTASPVCQKLLGDLKAPRLVLMSADGTCLAKSDTSTDLKASDAELLLRNEVEKRGASMQQKLVDARQKAESGDKETAIKLYQEVMQQKCLLPELARKASQALNDLGVNVSLVPSGPNWQNETEKKIQRLMELGLQKEEEGRYANALHYYEKAHKADPADPLPLRYLAELYRHDIGDWDEASRLFREILNSESDPLSRAVALHGLGKITIHNGDFKKGLELLEESVQVYPLALAYRNLAVYWNSEGDSEKCNHYIDESLKIDPYDQFNRIFAAVFMAQNGRREEALKIATDNEKFLPASYNLAAIYAQLGMKDKALEMLRRHFFEYERRQEVRAEEMMEARVDRVFDSLIQDERFLALTRGADGKLPMRAGTTAH